MLKPFHETVQEMKGLAKMLRPYSFPLTSHQDEEAISCLKQRDVVVDGYEVVVYFNSCSYGPYRLDTAQVFGRQFTFLPFNLVCKIVKTYLGDKNLSLVEVIAGKDNSARKIYVWTVYYDKDGETVPNPFNKRSHSDAYGDFKFLRVAEQEMNFF